MADELSISSATPVFGNSLVIIPGGQVWFYEAGTTNLVTIFASPSNTMPTPMPNPVNVDTDGRIPQVFYSGSAPVEARIFDQNGVLVKTINPVARVSEGGAAAVNISAAPHAINSRTEVQGQLDVLNNRSAPLANAGTAGLGLLGAATGAEALREMGVRQFNIPPTIIANAGTYTFQHNFGARATVTSMYLQCVTADGGYTPGDVIHIAATADDGTGLSVIHTINNVVVRIGANGPGKYVHRDSKNSTTLSAPDWLLIGTLLKFYAVDA